MTKSFICLLAALTLAASALPAAAQGTAFSYQGQLQSGGGPANGSYDLTFKLFTGTTNTTPLAGPVTNSAIGVTNGSFTTLVDFGPGAFTGPGIWIEIAARINATGNFVTLAPRQQVTPTPYAISSENASGLNGLTIQPSINGTPNLIVGPDNFIAAGVLGASVGGGTNNNIAAGASWSALGGGYGNSIAANSYLSFLGGGYDNIIGTDATIDVICGGQGNTMAYVDHAFIGGGGANVIQGSLSLFNSGVYSYSSIVGGNQNTIGAGAIYSFIGGGFYNYMEPSSSDSTLVGGSGNDIYSTGAFLGGGLANYIFAGGGSAVIGGGEYNEVSSAWGFLGGGADNTLSGGTYAAYASLGGGEYNTAGAEFSTLGGGYRNSATNNYSTVPGGSNNVASGVCSFAAGSGAVAANVGAFVWADLESTPFTSTTANSFNVRASGGVNFVTSGTGVTVDGQKLFAGTNGGALYGLNASQLTFGTVPLAQLPASLTQLSSAVVTNSEPLVLLGNLILTGGFGLPATANITSGGNAFIYSDASANTYFGANAGLNGRSSGGDNNLALGAGALQNNTTGANNVATGTGALQNNTASGNTADGGYALQANTGGGNNVAVGYNALNHNLGGNNNVAAGVTALAGNTGGDNNAAFGTGALQNNTASGNTADGGYALQSNTAGNNNVAVGFNALQSNTTGVNNTASGFDALQNSAANSSTAIGGYALQNLQTGDNNIALGYNAGNNLINGANNIYIGNGAHSSESGVIRIGDANNQTLTYIAGVIQDPSVTTLTITGGSDLAEPFAISTADQPISDGEVVVIDEVNPGQLKLTDRPYDTRVAGVVSGANGVHPGIQMHQQGLLDGGRNVALSGRVYVQADTSNGAIHPGDMLTTSRTPGRAMRVNDHARAEGAILGKAMTALKSGRGMVLVLVTLQ